MPARPALLATAAAVLALAAAACSANPAQQTAGPQSNAAATAVQAASSGTAATASPSAQPSAAKSTSASPAPQATHSGSGGGTASPRPVPTHSSAAPRASHTPSTPTAAPAYCNAGGSRLWTHLTTCGWPGAGNTGPNLSQCPGHVLHSMGGSLESTITIRTPNRVISCASIRGMLNIEARNVTVKNSTIISNSGRTGTAANGTADITVSDGASAKIENVKINGDDGVHACIWHQGVSLFVNHVNCFGIDDGIFSWADTSYSATTGDNFTIENSYFHGFTTATSNGHEDGYQTEGAANGLIKHNTYEMTTVADSAIAIWDSIKSSRNIAVTGNLITGGGFAVYAEDYNPGDSGPGDASAVGGFTVTNIRFTNNSFSTYASGCVGEWGIWFARPTWGPYHGGPTDGWHRSGNRVLETRQSVNSGNPYSHGQLCS